MKMKSYQFQIRNTPLIFQIECESNYNIGEIIKFLQKTLDFAPNDKLILTKGGVVLKEDLILDPVYLCCAECKNRLGDDGFYKYIKKNRRELLNTIRTRPMNIE